MKKVTNWFKNEAAEYRSLLRNIPALLLAAFCLAVVMMNTLANKTIVSTSWIDIDGGILCAWLIFMAMDLTAQHFGPRAATKMSLVGLSVNLLVCVIFGIASVINVGGGAWSPAWNYVDVHDFEVANEAVNTLFAGSWQVLLASSVAFIVSALVNNTMNWSIGMLFKHKNAPKTEYISRAYISTMLGQFVDNWIFNFLLFIVLFQDPTWNILSVTTCAALGSLVELFMEIIFSPIGYKIVQRWRRDKIGQEYIDEYGTSLVRGK